MTFILVVEDDEKIGANVVLRLREHGLAAHLVRSAEDAEAWLRKQSVDLLLLDVRLPGVSGIDLLHRLGEAAPLTVVISGEASMGETIEATRLGVYDFIDKPFSRERLLKSVDNALDHFATKRQLDDLRGRDEQILGRSAAVLSLRKTIEKIAPTDARVLIRGESGTGKSSWPHRFTG